MTSTGVRIVSEGRGRARRGGFSLLEVAIGTVVLTMGISAVLSVIVKYSRMVRVNNESTIAQQAARQMLERMQEQTFSQVFALYNTSTADDPGGPGTAPGRNFVVPGLAVQPNDADGRVGEIDFPMSGTQLRENVTDLALGMPRDLNGNGATDALNHATDYVLLPVTITLRWRGASGNQRLTLRHLLTNR
jgi:type II secretory pathway pseudopilin PulG